MPRPSKQVSLETLGGRIRAARENLHLSLADVANGHYSTSLISQIERNRIEPSQESLRFLAERLALSLDDLAALAQQHRAKEIEKQQDKSFEELRLAASKLLAQKDYACALTHLQDLSFPQIPQPQRWRLAALRGQCYFEQRKFLKAQHDFVYAVNEQPQMSGLPSEQKQELLLLHLHLAGAYRELRQLDAASEQYKITLNYVNSETPFGYVAEVHWGLALIAHAQANQTSNTDQCSTTMKEMHLRTALEHAETARFLYRSIGARVRADTVTCHIAQIEQKLGAIDKVRHYLQEVLATWTPVLGEQDTDAEASTGSAQDTGSAQGTIPTRDRRQEIANIVSYAAYSLADIELEAQNFELALRYSELALEAGKRSYKLRRADAYVLRGRILEAINFRDPEVEQAFRTATEELKDTDRIAARISAHVRLAQHLLKIGKGEEGEQQLELAHLLLHQVSISSPPSTETEDAAPS
jgi:transcriptional regulator with XRE-family HTH domain